MTARPWSKVLLVLAGYLLALLIAWGVVALYSATTTAPDRDGGMAAFGDGLLFLGVFAVTSLPATGAALFFLRPYRAFWHGLAAVAVVLALTGIVALVDTLASHGSSHALLGRWSMVSPLLVLVAPMLALSLILCGLLAPTRVTRLTLFGAGAVEIVLFVSVVLIWISH